MRAFMALVSREINERKALLAAAAVASLLPLLAPLLPSTGSNPASDIREAVMWVMVFGLVPLFALLLGASFIGRDLAEGRLGFYYAQPISGMTIWFGKLMAVMVLLWTSQFVVMLPTVLLAPGPFLLVAPKGPLGPYDPLWFTVLPLWLGPIGVLLLAHAVGTVWRARSAWVVIDLVAFLTVIGCAWFLFRPFFFLYTAGVAKIGFLWMVSIFLGALVVGGAAQLVSGRVDSRRGHRALSMTVWSILIGGILVLGGWTWWIRSAAPKDLSASRQVALGAGDWIAVMGPSPGRVDYQPRFIINVADGRWIRADSSMLWDMRDLVIAENQSRAVWLSPITLGSAELMFANLDVVRPEAIESGLEFDVFVRDLALSDDGDRVAVIQDATVMVFDLESRTQLVAAQVAGDFEPHSLGFEGRDRVRIETIDSKRDVTKRYRFQTRYLDIGNRQLSNGDEPRLHYSRKTLQRGGSSSLVSFVDLDGGEQEMVLVDEATGERVAELGRMVSWGNVRIVGDRLVVHRWERGSARIEIFDGYGELLDTIVLDDVGQVYEGGEIGDGTIAVGLWTSGSGEDSGWRLKTMVIDIEAGTGEVVLEGYAPVLGLWASSTSPGAWDIGATASRVFRGSDDSLHLWDPETNELEQLIPVPD